MPDPVVPPVMAAAAAASSSSSSPPQVEAPPASRALFGKYEVGRLLGCGAFAKVYHGRDTASGQSVALKVLSKPKIQRAGLSGHVKREIFAMRRLRHPHVVRLHEVLATRSKIYFVLEFAKGGELFSRLQSGGRLHEDVCRRLFHQLISAVAYSHSRGVFHRDLKPENLLLDEAGRLKVSDFGLAAVADHLQQQQQNVPTLFHTLCGTPAYVAPEILSKRAYDAAKADIWSCGVILFVLVAGFLPFNDANLMALYRRIYRGEYRCPRWVSPDLKRLLSRLLDVDPRTRITAAEIIEDPWFRKGLDVGRFMAIAGPGFHHREEIELKIAKIDHEDDDDDDDEREMNAFDIISSFSSGFDLSGLFADSPAALDCPSARTRERFIVVGRPEALLERVDEVVAEAPETEVRRRKIAKKGRRAGTAVEGRTGELVVWLEVHRLNRQLSVVEVEVGGREVDEVFWREKLRPVLWATVSEPVSPMCGSVRVSSEDEETASVRSV